MLDATNENVLIEKPTKARAEEIRRMEIWLNERITAGKRKAAAEVVTLTPVLARLLLDRNPINRPISKANSSSLAADIANDRFEFNGESIVVSNTGTLIDGQHRCEQVIATGRSIETVIVFGPTDGSRYTIDTGKPKTVSNFLAMKGKLYTVALSSAACFHLEWRKRGAIGSYTTRQDLRPTKSEILSAVDELRGLESSVEFTVPSMKTVRSHALLAFCHYVFWKKSGREVADNFIQRLIDGDGLRKGDPIHYCRNRLLGFGRGVHANTRAELVFKCWNGHRIGETIDHFKLSGHGKLPKVER